MLRFKCYLKNRKMKLNIRTIAFLVLTSFFTNALGQPGKQAQSDDLSRTILRLDSLFWQAYNACDADKMETFFTEDLEFYHDKGGLTTPRSKMIESVRKGMCGNTNWRLRREAVAGSVRVFPLNNYGAILSGEHVFYINETGKKERLDGLARFTHVWQFRNNEWKMSRVLSYDHGPAPYKTTRKEISLPLSTLKRYAGQYESAKAGTMTIRPEGNALALEAGSFKVTLFPETEHLFFMKERDLQFEFVKENGKVVKVVVHESGEVVEEAGKKE